MNKLAHLMVKSRNWLTANQVNVIDTSEGYTQYYFGSCIVFYILFILVRNSSFIVGGGMIAEMASNYYLNAESASWWHKLFATDAGYVPFLQRIIALIPSLCHMPALSIPYFYNWSSLVISAALVGSFCAIQFRALLESDLLRFLVSLAILVFASDSISRQLMNFTYGGGFFVTTIMALAALKRQQDVPWWAWFIPLFIFNKPVFLIFVPLFCLVAIISNSKRWRLITYCSVVLGIIQALVIYAHHRSGICWHEYSVVLRVQPDYSTLLQKLWWSLLLLYRMVITMLLGMESWNYINNLFFGRDAGAVWAELLLLVMTTVVMIVPVLVRRNNASLLSGFSLVVALGVCLFNNCTLPQCSQVSLHNWTPVPNNMSIIYTAKYYTIAWHAVLLSVVAMLAAYTPPLCRYNNYFHGLLVCGFLAWLFLTHWLDHMFAHPSYAVRINLWRQMSGLVDQANLPVCVGLSEVGWFYERNCHSLSPEVGANMGEITRNDVLFKIMELVNLNDQYPGNKFSQEISVAVPAVVKHNGHYLQGIMVYFLLNKKYFHSINLEAKVYLQNGHEVSLFGTYADLPNAQMIYIFANTESKIPVAQIKSVLLKFSVPVKILLMPKVRHDDQARKKLSVDFMTTIDWVGE